MKPFKKFTDYLYLCNKFHQNLAICEDWATLYGKLQIQEPHRSGAAWLGYINRLCKLFSTVLYKRFIL